MGLDQTTQYLVRIAAGVTRGDEGYTQEALREAVRVRVPTRQIREMLLQVVLFTGFPRVIHAFETFSEIIGRPATDPAACPPPDYWLGAGRETFDRIYGRHAQRVLDTLQGYHPDLADWILRDAYGKVLSRPVLDAKTRELTAVAMLSILRLPRQLYSHARGALNVGASAEEIRAAVEEVAPLCDPDALVQARQEVEKVLG